jgi:hypothetical protein
LGLGFRSVLLSSFTEHTLFFFFSFLMNLPQNILYVQPDTVCVSIHSVHGNHSLLLVAGVLGSI